MLTIFPSDQKKYRDLLDNYNVQGSEQAILVAEENDKTLGYIMLDVVKYKVYILDIVMYNYKDILSIDEDDKMILDSIIRAAASFALNRNIFVLQSNNMELSYILESFGFKITNNIMSIDLSKILKGCKKCQNDV